MTYILDSNILIQLVRENVKVVSTLQEINVISDNSEIVSFASVGESLAFSLKNKWGIAKNEKLESFLRTIPAIPMRGRRLADAYADIDAFSQGRHPTLTSTFTARNMGKNDLWIAATAHVYEAILLTTDNDFDHLMPHFLTIQKITI
jgi:tRNA(fMet)-specific endonuclease VapC